MLKLFKKTPLEIPVKKEWTAPDMLWDVRRISWYNFSSRQCYQYYTESSPLFTAIDRITSEVKSIVPKVYDTKKKTFVENHPILDLLKNPNTNLTWSEFVGQFANNILIAGNNFTVATNMPGKVDKPPLEIFIEPPPNISIMVDSRDGYPGTYQITDSQQLVTFTRDPIQFRFFDSKYRQDATREIYQTKNFSPYTGQWQKLWGMSVLYPIYFELEQFREASVHNLSLLQKGARPSGIMYLKDDVSDEQAQRIQQQVMQAQQGADNAGRVIVVAGSDGSWQEMSVSNKDMDFLNLKKNVSNSITNIYKVPLPLVSPDNMTLSNYEIAQLALYDNAVLPLTKWIFEELTDFLMKRYPDSENLILACDQREIPALQSRHTQQIINLQKIGALKLNEIRALMSRDPVEGGDTVFINSGLVPVMQASEEPEPTPEPTLPAKASDDEDDGGEDDEQDKAKQLFVTGMKEYGSFTDAEIEDIWAKSVIQRD
jgi:HK97 family phage portal protein